MMSEKMNENKMKVIPGRRNQPMQFVNLNDYFCDFIPTPEQAAVEDAEQLEPLQDDHPR